MPSTNSPPRRRRRGVPRKGDLREEAILDAAEMLLERDGFEPLTVDEIAKGADISRAALYFYFGSKQEVVTALVARTVAVLREGAKLLVEEVHEFPPEQMIELLLQRIERQWLEHGVVMRAAVENRALIPEVRELWDDTVDSFIDPVAEMLVRAGVPENPGPGGARALAESLSWMGERNFYLALFSEEPKSEIRRTAETQLAIWWRIMDNAAAKSG
ncbi:MAG TPA: TetR/AcrR family transcriptional regulator [Solirubrobacterales bacterium]|nr:TetR/AcrR family transcriptional regulator [Solirubrobacterales bacterium]